MCHLSLLVGSVDSTRNLDVYGNSLQLISIARVGSLIYGHVHKTFAYLLNRISDVNERSGEDPCAHLAATWNGLANFPFIKAHGFQYITVSLAAKWLIIQRTAK